MGATNPAKAAPAPSARSSRRQHRRELGARLRRAGDRRAGDQVLLHRRRDRRLRFRGRQRCRPCRFGRGNHALRQCRDQADGATADAEAAGDQGDHRDAGAELGKNPAYTFVVIDEVDDRELGPQGHVGRPSCAQARGRCRGRRPRRRRRRQAQSAPVKRGAAEGLMPEILVHLAAGRTRRAEEGADEGHHRRRGQEPRRRRPSGSWCRSSRVRARTANRAAACPSASFSELVTTPAATLRRARGTCCYMSYPRAMLPCGHSPCRDAARALIY